MKSNDDTFFVTNVTPLVTPPLQSEIIIFRSLFVCFGVVFVVVCWRPTQHRALIESNLI